MNGWFRFWRCMRDHPVWDLPPGQFKVWMTLLAMANLKPAAWYDGGERVQIAPGALVTSQEHLAKEARVSRKVARLALASLERIGSIRTKVRANRWTLVEVVNWPTYQGAAPEKGQPGANPNRAEGPTGGPTDLRGGNGREGPTGGPTENPQEGHSLRRKSQREIAARSIRRGGAPPPDPRDPRPGADRSRRTAAKEVKRERALHNAPADADEESQYSSSELEALSGVAAALLSRPLGASDPRVSPDGASLKDRGTVPSGGGGEGGGGPDAREEPVG